MLSVDPYLVGMQPDDTLSDMQRRQRDQAWDVIQPLVHRDDEEIIFQAKTRGILISEAIERTGISKPTIYNYLRKYWRGG